MNTLKDEEKKNIYIEVQVDGTLAKKHNRSHTVMEKPAVEIDGMSLEKRCYQLFDPAHVARVERKVKIAIDMEKREKKDFSKLSVQKKLKVLDS